MAQHIPIQAFPQKKFREIEKSIRKAFDGIPFHTPYQTSTRYLHDPSVSIHLRENENELVYQTQRYIGEGFVCGTATGDFEIHFDRKEKKVAQIYLVA